MIYKAVPYIYHKTPAEEDLYALFLFNARLARRDASAAIFLGNKLRFSKGVHWSLNTARKNGLTVKESSDFTAFMLLVKELLRRKHDVSPVHSVEEFNSLASRFPNNIKLFVAYRNEQQLAGLVTYENQNVIHAQYIGYTEQGRKLGATKLIYNYLINERSSNKKYFDFGISTKQKGRYLDPNLAYYKESLGARTVMYDFYEIDLI